MRHEVPEARFQALAERLTQEGNGSVLWLGVEEDRELCERLNQGVRDGRGINLAGETKLEGFTALLQVADVVVANDSGGMHLAAAVGTPVVACYGITDPVKTGPLGDQAVVLQHSEIRSRAVPRESADAVRALARITVDEVYEHVLAFLGDGG